MRQLVRLVAACLILGSGLSGAALAQKQGGVLKLYHRDSPASPSMKAAAVLTVGTRR